MPSWNVFDDDAFGYRSLTGAIIKAPYKPGRIGELGLFEESGITTTLVQVEEVDGQLSLIQTSERGAPAPNPLTNAKRKLRPFKAWHLTRESTVVADEVQGLRAFGSENEVETVMGLVSRRLTTLRAMHEVTLEHLRIGALKGTILDADGSTLLNLFTEFGVSQQAQDFVLSDDDTDVRGTCVAALRKIEDELGGSTYTGARAFCSAGFFDALVAHPNVQESFKYQEGQVLRSDIRRGFLYGGITWEEYRGSVVNPAGTSMPFITANEAILFPEGAQTVNGGLFQTWFAPADFEETVNTVGLPVYAKQAPDPSGLNRSRLLHTQSNPLPICLRPRAVIRVTKS